MINRPLNTKKALIRHLKYASYKDDQDGAVWDMVWDKFISRSPTDNEIMNLLESTVHEHKKINKSRLIYSIACMETNVDTFSFFLEILQNDKINNDLRLDFEEAVMILHLTKNMSTRLIEILENEKLSLIVKQSIANIFTDLETYEPIDISRLKVLAENKDLNFKLTYTLKNALKYIKVEGIKEWNP